MRFRTQGLSFAILLGGVLVSVPAFAVSGYSTVHLNVRAGPGTQYPILGTMETNVRTQIDGCLDDYSWCSTEIAGISGWASAQYLVVDEGGEIMEVQEAGSATGIPVIAAEGFEVVEVGEVVGEVVGPSGAVEAIVPEAAVIEYIVANPVPAVQVNGEIVVGATLSEDIPLYDIPGSEYGYAILNGVPVLVDVNALTVVYIYRA